MPAEIRADGEPFRLADREVRPRLHEIVGPTGIERLNPRAMAVLLALARRADGFASKRELLDEVWTDLFVTEEVLTTAIWELRRAFGDDARAPRFIRTLPRRGYRLLPPVEAIEAPAEPTVSIAPAPKPAGVLVRPAPPRPWRRWLVLAAFGALAAAVFGVWLLVRPPPPGGRAPLRSVAVLPFASLGGDESDGALADGLTDTLITALAEPGRFRVVSRASVLAVTSSHRTAPQIGQALDVDAIVEGTLAREGDRIVLNAQLIDARSDEHLWARTYERRFEHLLDLQVEVARSLRAAIAPLLEPPGEEPAAPPILVSNGPAGAAWRFRTSGEIWSDPVRADEAILFGSRDGFLYAVEAETGQELWRLSLGDEVRARPVLAGEIVLGLTSEGTLVAAERTSGLELWRSRLPAPVELPPALAGERVVTADESGKVCAYDLHSGRELWRTALSGSLDGLATNGDIVLVSDWSPSLYALDPVSGEIEWSVRLGDRAAASLTLAGDRILLPMADDTVRALALDGGRELWRHPFESPTSVAAWRDRVVVTGAGGAVAALDAGTGESLWEFHARGGLARPAVVDDRVFVGSRDLSLHVLDPWTGARQLRLEMQAWILTEASLADGRAIFGSLDGSVYAVPIPEAGPQPVRMRQVDDFRISAEVDDTEAEVAVDSIGDDSGAPSVRWHRRLDGSVSRALALDPTTLFASAGHALVALDRATGREMWRATFGGEASTRPVLTDDRVLVGSRDDALYSLDAATGAELWRFATGGDIVANPTVFDHTVYLGSRDGFLYALDAEDGRELWRRQLDVIHSTPATAGRALFVATRGDRVRGLSLDDGADLWAAKSADWAVADLVVADRDLLVASCDGTVQALDLTRGEERWRFVIRGDIWYRPLVADGKLFFGSADLHVYAVDLASGRESWRFRTGNRALTSVAWWQGLVLAGSYDRHLYALDAANGAPAWSVRASGAVASPTVSGNQVAFGTADGLIVVLDLPGGSEADS
ncbi:MAG: PQQ-binding-like beta-propeller repeat protein [Holophagales bacterium]|nr:PQQ-binding-like beta-propeller repeat protein [Holophagales bacterium]